MVWGYQTYYQTSLKGEDGEGRNWSAYKGQIKLTSEKQKALKMLPTTEPYLMLLVLRPLWSLFNNLVKWLLAFWSFWILFRCFINFNGYKVCSVLIISVTLSCLQFATFCGRQSVLLHGSCRTSSIRCTQAKHRTLRQQRAKRRGWKMTPSILDDTGAGPAAE